MEKNPVYEFVKKKGWVTFRELEQEGLSYYDLEKLMKEGVVVQEERGIYQLEDTYIDEYFAYQYRFPKAVFSLETALWLHGLSLTVPFEPVMTVAYGTNTKGLKEAGIKPVVVRSHQDLGVVRIERQKGQAIAVYDKERTLVECLRSVYSIDVQVIGPAFRMYVQQGEVNLPRLFEYARIFRVEKKLQSYIEVLT